MAYLALNTFAGTGGLMQVELSFAGYNSSDPSAPAPYFNVADIKAVVVTPATSTSVETETPVAITKIGTMTFKTVAAVPVGKNLRIYRETNITAPVVDFVSLQVVSERDLDNSAKQTLYAVMEAKDQAELAGATADYASLVATAANVAAAAAIVTADAAAGTAQTAINSANAAVSVANAAVGTANAASTVATAAANQASQASADAAAVLGVANTANANASTALSTANTAKTTADAIAGTANTANSNASTALSTANAAAATANGIAATANSAQQAATQAVSTANTASGVASGVDAKATQAQTDAAAALTAANAANSRTTADIAESGSTNLYFNQNRVRASVMTGIAFATNAIVTATDTLLAAIGKLQAQITDRYTKAEVDNKVGFGGSNENYVNNASFTVNQRGLGTLSSAANNTYFADRWKAAQAGTSVTSVTDATLQENYINITAGRVCQRMEIVTMPTGTYTLSHEGTATITLERNGVVVATVAGNTSTTFTLTKAGMTTLTLFCNTGTVLRPKLERGSVKTPFVVKNYGEELANCMRWFQRVGGLGISFSGLTAGAIVTERAQFSVQMNAVPTLSTYITATATGLNSLNYDSPSQSGFRGIFVSTSGSGYLDFNAVDYVQASCEP